MRLIKSLLLLAVFGFAALMGYNYLTGRGLVLRPPAVTGPEAGTARERGEELAGAATEKAKEAAGKLGEAVSEGGLTAKILSKMALDDLVKARNIAVHTSGSVVTLSGTVASDAERERAVRLAKETAGVTEVVDKLETRRP